MIEKWNKVSNTAVQKATGKSWDNWIKIIDKEGGDSLSHKEIAKMLSDKAWELLTSPKGLKVWLGEVPSLKFKKGEKFKTKEDTTGEIRTIEPGTKIRLIYQPKFLKQPSTLQIYLICPRNTPEKTNIRFHQEKLSNNTEREKMREHWQKALEKISRLI